MTTQQKTVYRRTAIKSLLVGATAGLAGCSTLNDRSDDGSADAAGESIQSVDVDGLELVIELERDAIDQLNLIEPSGDLFAQRSIESGVSRTTISIGTDYPPGEYELIGLASEETVETTPIALEPELELTELRLGRDYPEEMYEGARDSSTESEAILSVVNNGTGPTALTTLRFDGDVPFPSHESYDEAGESGIHDPESGGDADSITIPAGETTVVYSNTLPFSPASTRSKCDSVGRDGQFTVSLSATHESENLDREYIIHYLGTSPDDCEIEIEGTA